MKVADSDDMVAAQCWYEARGGDFQEATPVQIVGTLREIRQQAAILEGARALVWVAAQFGRKA